MEYNKKFLIIGNLNNITYREFFPLIKYNKVWMGMTMNGTGQHWFRIPSDYDNGKIRVVDGIRYATIGSACWWTNLDNKKRHEHLICFRTYNHNDYPYYDNYDCINVNKVVDIPVDYTNVMGVPIGFLNIYNPDLFEIIGLTASWDESDDMRQLKTSDKHRHNPIINGKEIYRKIISKKKGVKPMEITIKEVTVAELFDGYEDNGENGVVGYGGKLDFRPAYQREFVYGTE